VLTISGGGGGFGDALSGLANFVDRLGSRDTAIKATGSTKMLTPAVSTAEHTLDATDAGAAYKKGERDKVVSAKSQSARRYPHIRRSGELDAPESDTCLAAKPNSVDKVGDHDRNELAEYDSLSE
ncbi:hypothetical protein EV182_007789, partial [Spiromyces aspiralis]